MISCIIVMLIIDNKIIFLALNNTISYDPGCLSISWKNYSCKILTSDEFSVLLLFRVSNQSKPSWNIWMLVRLALFSGSFKFSKPTIWSIWKASKVVLPISSRLLLSVISSSFLLFRRFNDPKAVSKVLMKLRRKLSSRIYGPDSKPSLFVPYRKS